MSCCTNAEGMRCDRALSGDRRGVPLAELMRPSGARTGSRGISSQETCSRL
jgi:hypothetical protein